MVGPGAVKCELTLSATTQAVPASASQITVAVGAGRECAWSSRSDAAWTQVAPASGQGDGTLTLNVGANTQQSGRTANVIVNDVSILITQAAAPTPCSYAMTPVSRHFSDPGGTGTFTLQTGSGCSWTSLVSVSWITLVSPPSGTGPATFTYLVARNQGKPDRSGTITVAGQTHTVAQDGR
jgi:hypothetical protein